MDEVSTVIFSLGNSSYLIPTESVVDLADLLRPLMPTSEATPLDSARYLLQENNHPPAYFALAHLWMDLFPTQDGVASITVARFLSACLGSLSIPIVFWASRATFQSSIAGLISAAFMAVSPLGVFLAQEARHYGLAITLITATLGCFVVSARAIWQHQTPSWSICFGWIVINAMAVANHYFSVLTFAAQGLMIAAIAWQQSRQNGWTILWKPHWRRLYIVIAGTLIGILVWMPILLSFYGSPQSSFLRSEGSFLGWINPIAHTLAATIFSIVTPAVFFAETPLEIGFMLGSTLLVLFFVIRSISILNKGFRQLCKTPQGHIGVLLMGGFWLMMLAIFALICYGYGSDITRGLRYKFSYYPALIILLGGLFSVYWSQRSTNGPLSIGIPFSQRRLSGRQIVQYTWLISLISTLLVVNDFAFSKFYAPERFVPFVQENSTHPIVFTTTEKIASQPTVIGARFLSIGWEIHRHHSPALTESGWGEDPPKFLVLKEGYGIEESVSEKLEAIINQMPQALDLWFIRSNVELDDPFLESIPTACVLSPNAPHGNKGGYAYIHYQCHL
ncbi:MAG: hypothetical protein F6K42_21575 [Leptolyngbya sp. SIO1D8]|nr:hypothetical protein [Leptolyngbya sp. SIO1D8]